MEVYTMGLSGLNDKFVFSFKLSEDVIRIVIQFFMNDLDGLASLN